MQFLYEILPVFLFFIAFKAFDMYVAIVVGIVATLVQVLITRIWSKKMGPQTSHYFNCFYAIWWLDFIFS